MRGRDIAGEIIKLHRLGTEPKIIAEYVGSDINTVQIVIRAYEKQEKNDERENKGQDRC